MASRENLVEDKDDYIGPFDGEYRFLSNFYPCRLIYDGMQYPTAEHAYQAAKSHDYAVRMEIKNLPTPGDAKRAGKRIVLREHWDAIRVSIMTEIQLAKYTQNAVLAAMLIRTGAQQLQERNNWGDRFWGMDMSGRGDNQLGEALMRVRDILSGSYKMRVLTDTVHSELSYLTRDDASL